VWGQRTRLPTCSMQTRL